MLQILFYVFLLLSTALALPSSSLQLSLQIKDATLDNGLHLIVIEDHAAPIVSYQTWFNVGSADDPNGKTGIAHLFEHMMFNGTPRFPQGKYDAEIERYGGENNAFTDRDYTGYYATIAKEQLELIAKLESDRMAHLIIDPTSLSRERKVVLEERNLRVDNSLFGKAYETLYLTAFLNSPYRWPIIGLSKDIEGLSVQDCQTFFKTFYAPNNATIVIAGDVTFKKAIRLVKKYYGKIKSFPIPSSTRAVDPPQTEERRVILRFPAQSEMLLIGYKIPGLKDEDSHALKILAQILFHGASSRAEQRLLYEKQLVTSISGDLDIRKDPSLFIIVATPHPGVKSEKVMSALEDIFSDIKRKPVSSEELQKAKNQRLSSTVESLRTVAGLSSSAAYFQTMYGDYHRMLTELDRFQAVKAGQVQKIAQRILENSQRTIVTVVPEKTK
ncbi:MAG TPA: pitrilysin family protein [Bdellovibrionota bacterium]|nr:pitrilysin family protein [Bdellovibrionota bacterium]